jgi:hypothetical protein
MILPRHASVVALRHGLYAWGSHHLEQSDGANTSAFFMIAAELVVVHGDQVVLEIIRLGDFFNSQVGNFFGDPLKLRFHYDRYKPTGSR